MSLDRRRGCDGLCIIYERAHERRIKGGEACGNETDEGKEDDRVATHVHSFAWKLQVKGGGALADRHEPGLGVRVRVWVWVRVGVKIEGSD